MYLKWAWHGQTKFLSTSFYTPWCVCYCALACTSLHTPAQCNRLHTILARTAGVTTLWMMHRYSVSFGIHDNVVTKEYRHACNQLYMLSCFTVPWMGPFWDLCIGKLKYALLCTHEYKPMMCMEAPNTVCKWCCVCCTGICKPFHDVAYNLSDQQFS